MWLFAEDMQNLLGNTNVKNKMETYFYTLGWKISLRQKQNFECQNDTSVANQYIQHQLW